MMGKKNKLSCFFIFSFTGYVLKWGDITSEVDLTSSNLNHIDLVQIRTSWWADELYLFVPVKIKAEKWMEVCTNICFSSLSWNKIQLHQQPYKQQFHNHCPHVVNVMCRQEKTLFRNVWNETNCSFQVFPHLCVSCRDVSSLPLARVTSARPLIR